MNKNKKIWEICILCICMSFMLLAFSGCSDPEEEYDNGYDAGYDAGYDIGYDDGYEEGEDSGYGEGYDSGYDEGYNAGLAAGSENEDESDDNEDEPEADAIEVTVYEVTAIEDGILTLSAYELTDEGVDYVVTDSANVDLSYYEDLQLSEEYTVSEDAIVYISDDGVATESDSSVITVGDMLVIYTNADNVSVIVVYQS